MFTKPETWEVISKDKVISGQYKHCNSFFPPSQKMIEKQVNILYETKRACDSHGNTQFQDWLLQENKQTTPDQELLIKQRYG